MEQYSDYPRPEEQKYSSQEPMASVMTMGQWLVTMLLMMIPIANMVLLIVWAVSKTENPNRSNWAKAQLIMMVVAIVLWMLFAGVIMGAMGGLSSLVG